MGVKASAENEEQAAVELAMSESGSCSPGPQRDGDSHSKRQEKQEDGEEAVEVRAAKLRIF